MLEELKDFEYLGWPEYFGELFLLFKEKSFWKICDLHSHFYNRQIWSHRIFDGCLSLLVSLWIVDSKGDWLTWTGNLVEFACSDDFLELLFSNESLIQDTKLIFRDENITFNIQTLRGEIWNNAFPLKFLNFKRFLVDFSLLESIGFWRYSINPIFFETLFPLSERLKSNRTMTLERFSLLQDQLAKYGQEAEDFVIAYEKRRLNKDDIIHVSIIDVSAWFDVLSYDTVNSWEHDRLIEVKSFSSFERFHWSANEIRVAKMQGCRYCLYLVDRDRMHLPDYEPIIIGNAYAEIFKSNDNLWFRKPDGFIVQKINWILSDTHYLRP